MRTRFAITANGGKFLCAQEPFVISASTETRLIARTRFAFTAAFTGWVALTCLLPIDVSTSGDDAGWKATQAIRTLCGILPAQVWRPVSCRASFRNQQVTENEEEATTQDAPRVAVVARPKLKQLRFDDLLFSIFAPDHLIELPGTPPPVALS